MIARQTLGIRRSAKITVRATLLLLMMLLQFLILVVSLSVVACEIIKSTVLLLPRDVAYDNVARKALQKIRRQQEAQHLNILSTSGNENQVTMTMVGYKGGRIQDQINQDRAFVACPLVVQNYNNGETQLLMGVFDGHGNLGEQVSEYALQQLPKRLSEKIQVILQEEHSGGEDETDTLVKKVLVDSFLEIDESIPTRGQGGCTASVVLQLGTRLYIANAGDSISFIGIHNVATNTTRVVYTTREDKPHLPDEYNRIVKMGGEVNIPKDFGLDSSRVMYTDPETGYQMGLAMSRSIGDWEMVGVIAEPIVDVLDLRQVIANATNMINDECTDTKDETCVVTDPSDVYIFAVSATDGMMDYVTPQRVATAFAQAFYQQDDGPHPLTVAEDLILAAAKGWNVEMNGEYRDDIAVAASKIPVVLEKASGAMDEEL